MTGYRNGGTRRNCNRKRLPINDIGISPTRPAKIVTTLVLLLKCIHAEIQFVADRVINGNMGRRGNAALPTARCRLTIQYSGVRQRGLTLTANDDCFQMNNAIGKPLGWEHDSDVCVACLPIDLL